VYKPESRQEIAARLEAARKPLPLSEQIGDNPALLLGGRIRKRRQTARIAIDLKPDTPQKMRLPRKRWSYKAKRIREWMRNAMSVTSSFASRKED
jgi:hypothetical protein